MYYWIQFILGIILLLLLLKILWYLLPVFLVLALLYHFFVKPKRIKIIRNNIPKENHYDDDVVDVEYTVRMNDDADNQS